MGSHSPRPSNTIINPFVSHHLPTSIISKLHHHSTMAVPDTREDDFPAPSREISGNVGNIPTQVTRLDFSDKILLTISQRGRLSQWVYHTPLLITIKYRMTHLK